MVELVIASRNRGKIREIEALLRGVVDRVYSLDDFPLFQDVIEDGETFEANALKKGHAAARFTGKPALADDSGLVVDALKGAPGVRSARYSGDDATDLDNNRKLVHELQGVPAEFRTAAFHCVAALCLPDGGSRIFTGTLKGVILEEPRGEGGFGYDPLFMVPSAGRTLAEIPLEEKNSFSHRGEALRALRRHLAGESAGTGRV